MSAVSNWTVTSKQVKFNRCVLPFPGTPLEPSLGRWNEGENIVSNTHWEVLSSDSCTIAGMKDQWSHNRNAHIYDQKEIHFP